MTWRQLTERDCRESKLSAINPHDRDTCRSGVRSAMYAASVLPGRGPIGVDVPLYTCRLIEKSGDDDDDHFCHMFTVCVSSYHTVMCLSIGTPQKINFPFVPNGKFIILGVPKVGHITA